MAGSKRDEPDAMTRARLRWSSLRDPERYVTYDRSGWSRVARREWGNAPGRPYEDTEVRGTAGLIVYLIVGGFAVVAIVLILAMLGVLR